MTFRQEHAVVRGISSLNKVLLKNKILNLTALKQE